MAAGDLELFVAWAERHHRRILVLLIVIELAVGIGYSASLGPELRYWDEREYMQLATSLLTQHEYRFGNDLAFRPPLYPIVLAVARGMGAQVFSLRILNFGFLAGAMVLLDRIATAAARAAAGLLAAAWVLLNPVMIYTAGTLYPQTLAGFLLLGFVALIVREATSLFGAGVVFALLVLTVPSFAPLLGVSVLWLWQTRKRGVLWPVLELAAGTALPLAAWTLRNHAVLGSWVLVSTNSGLNLLYGNSEHATANSGVNADIGTYVSAAAGLGEVERDHYYRDMAVHWIAANADVAAKLYVAKLVHYFSSNDRLATATETSALRTVIATAAFVPLQLTLLARSVLAKRFPLKPVELLLLSLYLANALLAAVFFTRTRLRVPADFLLLALLGGLAGLAVRSPAEKDARPVARFSES